MNFEVALGFAWVVEFKVLGWNFNVDLVALMCGR